MSSAEPVGTLEVALAHATRLLSKDPRLAAEQAREILRVVPNHPGAKLLLGAATRASGNAEEAVRMIEPLARQHADWAMAHLELGLALGAAKRGDAAIASLRRAVQANPELGEGWRALGEHLTIIGDTQGADDAYARHIRYSTQDPRLMQAGTALVENRIAVAEGLLREHLKANPADVPAIRMLAEVAGRLGRYAIAETLLRRCLELAPSFTAARYNLALVLNRQQKFSQALAEIDGLLLQEPLHPGYRNLKAAILGRIGEYAAAIELYAQVLEGYPDNAKVWMSYGHALKTAGSAERSIEAYRKSILLSPELGEAYWSLANLKTYRFAPQDLEAMRGQLRRKDLGEEDRFHFEFCLGKALEDLGEYPASFDHYARGNELRRRGLSYHAKDTSAHVASSKSLFTREFFAQRSGFGCPAPDPIFIVGLPRAGSTLLEQILSSHPLVEGTQELSDIIAFSRRLRGKDTRGQDASYPASVADLSAADARALGEEYLVRTRVQRKTSAPYFIDKMPNNWAHVGLIQVILPNARIIDARRHPLACCFSGFKQHFARGQGFTYSLEDIGRYYHDYVELLAHFDAVLPGRIHRVIYEQLVEDTENQVRRLLDHCGLPFDERCLRFHQNERAVRTASSEQVRQPIYRDGVDHWRHYEPWLNPLKQALGPVLEAYPLTPQF